MRCGSSSSPWPITSGTSFANWHCPSRYGVKTTLREKLIKIGAKVVRHSRYTIFQMAEVAVSRELFSAIIDRIGQIGEMVANTA
jgi:hypothetical protein